MSKPKPPTLTSGIIVRKGEAVPNGAEAGEGTVNRPFESKEVPQGTDGTVAVTVRLDPDRYARLKHYGVDHRQSNQRILVLALDAFLNAQA
jgi:hypothetical protein